MFNQELYEKIDKVAIGSPCGSTLANLFLCHYENIWLNQCPSVHYERYVEDNYQPIL